MGSSLNYGARLPTGNVIQLELWRDPEGIRYAFTWGMSPTAKDRKLLARFKTEVAKDVCRLLGASRVAFPDSDADLNIAMAQ